MPSTNSVANYEALILSEISTVQDAVTVRTIYDLIHYAKKKEKEAENRELRPRPDGSENAAYYSSAIDFTLISSQTLQDAITGLLAYVTELENLLSNAG